MTGSYSYEDIPSDEVEELYRIEQFPDLSLIICWDIIKQCWPRETDSVTTIRDALADIEEQFSV